MFVLFWVTNADDPVSSLPQDDVRVALVMEYAAGGELLHRIRKRLRLPDAEAKFYAAEIADALQYMHNEVGEDNVCSCPLLEPSAGPAGSLCGVVVWNHDKFRVLGGSDLGHALKGQPRSSLAARGLIYLAKHLRSRWKEFVRRRKSKPVVYNHAKETSSAHT